MILDKTKHLYLLSVELIKRILLESGTLVLFRFPYPVRQYNDNFTMTIENNHILPYLIVGITTGKPFYPT